MVSIIPISEPDVTTVISWDSTTVDDYSEDDEPEDSNDLDYAEDEFDCAGQALSVIAPMAGCPVT